jgi:hypothetical protein
MLFRVSNRSLFPVACATVTLCATAVADASCAPMHQIGCDALDAFTSSVDASGVL